MPIRSIFFSAIRGIFFSEGLDDGFEQFDKGVVEVHRIQTHHTADDLKFSENRSVKLGLVVIAHNGVHDAVQLRAALLGCGRRGQRLGPTFRGQVCTEGSNTYSILWLRGWALAAGHREM
jgi:hypothetical protein